jgi:hypothetical protein
MRADENAPDAVDHKPLLEVALSFAHMRDRALELLNDALERGLPEDTMHYAAAARHLDELERREQAESAQGAQAGGIVMGEVRAAVWEASQEVGLDTATGDRLVPAFDVALRRRLGGES